MTITLTERHGSPRLVSGVNPTREYLYDLRGTQSEDAARTYFEANTPDALDDLPRLATVVEADGKAGDKLWRCEARYGLASSTGGSIEPGGSQGRRMRIGFSQTKIYRSLSTITSVALAGETAPDFGRLIGVSDRGPEGVDVIEPSFTFTRHLVIPAISYTDTYENLLFAVVGTVNNATFTGKPSGSVLLEGVESQYDPAQNQYAISFSFSGRLMETGIVVGDLPPVSKAGWDYLWVYYQDSEDASTGRVVKKAVAAYVEQIYRRTNFAALGV